MIVANCCRFFSLQGEASDGKSPLADLAPVSIIPWGKFIMVINAIWRLDNCKYVLYFILFFNLLLKNLANYKIFCSAKVVAAYFEDSNGGNVSVIFVDYVICPLEITLLSPGNWSHFGKVRGIRLFHSPLSQHIYSIITLLLAKDNKNVVWCKTSPMIVEKMRCDVHAMRRTVWSVLCSQWLPSLDY